eukprot:scaffold7977_cov128-Isochrysis_galbana.AAC.2
MMLGARCRIHRSVASRIRGSDVGGSGQIRTQCCREDDERQEPMRRQHRPVRRVDLGAGEVARPAHSSSLEEEEDGPRATTRLPAGRMRAALESMREFSRHMTAATWRTKRLLRLRTSQTRSFVLWSPSSIQQWNNCV